MYIYNYMLKGNRGITVLVDREKFDTFLDLELEKIIKIKIIITQPVCT